MQILNQENVKQQLTMSMAIKAIEKLLIIQAKHPKWITCPERLVIPTFIASDKHTQGSHLSMPAVVFDGEQEYAVVKLVTICPDNPSRNLPTTTAYITVSNNSTGEMLAFMEGVYVTQVRTAGLSGIATKYLAKPDSQVVAVLGCGGMAYEQLNAVLTVCPNIKQVNLWNRTATGAVAFQRQFSEHYPQWQVNFQVFDDCKQAIKNANIINLATRAKQGLFDLEAVLPDVHINAVGAYLPTMKEVSNEVVEACSHIFVDDLLGCHHEAGDLIQAHEDNNCTWQWDNLTGDLSDLVTQKQTIDLDSKGISLFKSVGAASFDAAVALKIAQVAVDKGIGQRIGL